MQLYFPLLTKSVRIFVWLDCLQMIDQSLVLEDELPGCDRAKRRRLVGDRLLVSSPILPLAIGSIACLSAGLHVLGVDHSGITITLQRK